MVRMPYNHTELDPDKGDRMFLRNADEIAHFYKKRDQKLSVF